MEKEWVTVQECIGLPGFPGTAPSVRLRLNNLSAGLTGVKRKRHKSKAMEYHISILPPYVHAFLQSQEERLELHHEPACYEAEPKDVWAFMFRLLTPAQQTQVCECFREGGISAVFPALFTQHSSI